MLANIILLAYILQAPPPFFWGCWTHCFIIMFVMKQNTISYSSIFVCKQKSFYTNKTVHKAEAYLGEVLAVTPL